MHFKIKKTTYTGADFADLSRQYSAARDASGQGQRHFHPATVLNDQNEAVARISYNGRVWPPGDWTPDMAPLYDNRA